MSESSRDPQASKPDAEKKQPETVLLTAEELKAIAGGAIPGRPPVSSQVLTTNPNPEQRR